MTPARYAELFLTESRDNLVAINGALLQLERRPDDAAPLDELFRAVHTLKGMAGVMGYAAVVDVAHEMEALLASARGGARPLDSGDAALLLEAADVLESAIDAAVAGTDAVDVSAICERLRGAVGIAPTSGTPAAGAPLAAKLPAGEGLAVRVRLAAGAPLPGARAMLVVNRARTLGDVTAVVPPENELLTDRFEQVFALRLKTDQADDVVTSVLMSAGFVEEVAIEHEAASPARAHATAPSTSERADVAWSAGNVKGALQRFVRIDLRRLDSMMNLIGELVIARGQIAQLVARHDDPDLADAAAAAGNLISDLQDGILASRMVPVWQVFDRFPRVVRDAARVLGKEIDFVIDGREIELDRALLEQIGDPLVHLLRNAVDHGIESPEARVSAGKPRAGRLVLSASRDRAAVVIRVTDDGHGIDREAVLAKLQRDGQADSERTALTDDELLRTIARPGFSTAKEVTNLSGRGVGVDAVVNRVRALGGSVELRTAAGEGTTLSLRLPVTLAIVPAMLTVVERETYAVPLTHVRETLRLGPSVLRRVRGRDVLVLRDEVIPLLSLRRVVDLPERDVGGSQVVVLEVADRRAGLVVDQLIGQQDIVVKPFDAVRGTAVQFSGATILSDGAPALILEPTSFL